jgi:hypothetical protein
MIEFIREENLPAHMLTLRTPTPTRVGFLMGVVFMRALTIAMINFNKAKENTPDHLDRGFFCFTVLIHPLETAQSIQISVNYPNTIGKFPEMTPTDAYTPAVVKYAGFLYMFQLEFPDKDAFPFLKDMFKMNVITHNSDNWLSFVDGEDYLDGVFFDEVESQTRFKKSSFLPDDFNIRVHFNSKSCFVSSLPFGFSPKGRAKNSLWEGKEKGRVFNRRRVACFKEQGGKGKGGCFKTPLLCNRPFKFSTGRELFRFLPVEI